MSGATSDLEYLEELLGSRARELSEQSALLLAAALASGRPNAHLLSVGEARKRYEADIAVAGTGEEVAEVREHRVPTAGASIEVREFRPTLGVLPAIIYLHGGGWVLGSVNSHQAVCRALANAAEACVFSVGYRLAPEAPFPAAVDDSYAAIRWVHANADALGVQRDRLAVAGDSAGGNLATVVAILCRDQGGPMLRMQVLAYPVTTVDVEHGFDTAYEGFFLYRDEMRWYRDNYLAEPTQRDHPWVSPLERANLGGLPPALIVTAQCDPLRPQGELYAQALASAGVEVRHRQWPGTLHGFFVLPHVFAEGAEAVELAGTELRQRFES